MGGSLTGLKKKKTTTHKTKQKTPNHKTNHHKKKTETKTNQKNLPKHKPLKKTTNTKQQTPLFSSFSLSESPKPATGMREETDASAGTATEVLT